jgi:CTP synthase (UTP-ammonia lyase)
VCGLFDADHSEYGSVVRTLLIMLSACVVGDNSARLSGAMRIAIAPGSLAERVWNAEEAHERFTCSYELNPEFEPVLVTHGLCISGRADNGEARIIELPGHHFFVATLF